MSKKTSEVGLSPLYAPCGSKQGESKTSSRPATLKEILAIPAVQKHITKQLAKEKMELVGVVEEYITIHEKDAKPWNTYTGKEVKRILDEALEALKKEIGVTK